MYVTVIVVRGPLLFLDLLLFKVKLVVGNIVGFIIFVLITCLYSGLLWTYCLTILLFGCRHTRNRMEDNPYLGLDPGNIDFFGPFCRIEKANISHKKCGS